MPQGNSVDEFMAAAVHDRPRAMRLLDAFPDLIHRRRGRGETALHYLAVEGYTDAVRFLAERGADVNATNDFGDTPLIYAATLGNVEIAKVLLQFGADPNASSETNENVLWCAVRSGSAELVDVLLKAGANGAYETEFGGTVYDELPTNESQRNEITNVLARHGVTRREFD